MDVLQEGQKIKHELYGVGVVEQSDEERTTIDFDEHGTKKFVTSLFTCEVLGEAPKKKTRGRRRKARVAQSGTETANAAA